jgi:serine/threonine-protein kinase PknK
MALAAAPEVPGFRALSPLGYGPASTLYSAQSDGLGRWVALTVYSTALNDDRTQRRFTRAFETARRLGSHPNAVTLLESGLTLDRRPFVASEIYERGTLDGRIAGRKPLDVAEVLHLGIALAGALETAHRADVVHGGVHPARILVGSDGEPALADLGLVPLVDRGGLVALVGPMSYHAAPEVLEGDPVTAATDVYSLASSLYSGLSLRPPYRGPNEEDTVASLLLRILQHAVPPIERQDVPPFLEQVLHQSLSCEAKERPDGPMALAKALQSCQAHLGLAVTEPVVLDVAASLRLASGDGITSTNDTTGYGPSTPMSTNGHGATGHGGSGSQPIQRNRSGGLGIDADPVAPAQRVFVPYPAPEPPAPGSLADDDAAAARLDQSMPPGDLPRAPLDGPALREAGFPSPPPLPGAPAGDPEVAQPPVARSAPPAPAAPALTRSPWETRSHGEQDTVAPDEDPWADLQLDPSVFAGAQPAYDTNERPDEQDELASARARTARDRDTPSTPAQTGPRALPVIVLMGLVAVLVAGVSWMIVTGEDPAQEEQANAPDTSRAVTGDGQPRANLDVTAAESAAGVQLDWDESGEGRQTVVILAATEPPQALPADAGTALLVPAARLRPQTGYCFAVVTGGEASATPAELAAAVPEEGLAPGACIRGATGADLRRE